MSSKRRGESPLDRAALNGEPYNAKAAAFVQRQTARRLLEGVARDLSREAAQLVEAGDDAAGAVKLVQCGKVRDALALLVGGGS